MNEIEKDRVELKELEKCILENTNSSKQNNNSEEIKYFNEIKTKEKIFNLR
jgi:hypothetical protein